MKKDPFVFVHHILNEISKIERSTKGMTLEHFKKNVDIQDATMRRIEIMGEAVKNLPASFRNKHPSVPWAKITGTRDKLIHHYFGVDVTLTWKIVTNELPKLKKQLKNIVDTRKKN